MTTPPRLGVALPGIADGGELVASARHAEDLGFESVWIPDLVNAEGAPALEPLTALAVLAGATSRIRLGVGVLVPALRPDALLAAQLATLQRLSGDRAVLGVGIGGPPTASFWSAVGKRDEVKGRRLDAALDHLASLLAGRPTVLEDLPGEPSVTLAPSAAAPEVLVGGQGEVAMRRAIRRSAGWLPSLLSPDELAAATAKLREMALGSAIPEVTVGIRIWDTEDAAALEAFRAAASGVYGMPPEQVDDLVVEGTPPAVEKTLAAYAAAGADRIIVTTIGRDWRRTWDTTRTVANGLSWTGGD
ncbi:LLM class flavin-dependent oxidoreductase [Amycolatopsis sp. CA-230715]|uniref:LLM class flavin-dependent oxidoreductase n=1 Tax=Amycolatopsis sp. CA-230715 TaxID=2745196 RepID=UPI001C00E4CC|nr:LLM class flavin-dependent oxidoreductase [Amycolatopsis sp. CA-230715]QWF85225.1 F420-dependent glucose-6-phosphate dehydrogenase [Amycolatopsis sp. CA-230715]